MRITWYGHAAFLVEGRDRVLIDPFLSGNPKSPVRPEEVECDIIVVTHGHGDHLGDAVDIAKRTGAAIVSTYEIAMYCQAHGARVDPMNLGSITHRNTRITLTPALHTSDIEEEGRLMAGGLPTGAVLDTGMGCVYHAGDTWVFSDMGLISRLYSPDVALLPIGDRFTMGPKEAALAVELIRPKVVVPMHYGTFDAIQQDPEEFRRLVTSARVEVLEPGGSIEV